MADLSTDREMHEGTLGEDGDHCNHSKCWCWDDRYMVVRRESCDELIEAVNAFIHQKGWKPLGGIQLSVTHRTWMNERKGYQESDTDICWAQAMARYV